jgi:hypothetical protein
MNLRALLAFGSLLLIGTGCPHDWVKGGTNDRAMAKDTREMLGEEQEDDDDGDCPEGMTLKKDCTEQLADGTCPVKCR